MGFHAFVAMPFGVKKGNSANETIDFNAVYGQYLKPALEQAGFEVFRADEETRAGDIRADMFQELLIADLVVADLTIDNPNVWYELGVRHALRARGVVLVQSQREHQPFDIYTERKLRYRLKDGVPDPDFLEADRQALAEMARETMKSWHGRKVSPVYALLPFLEEPEWKKLRIGGVEEFWDAYEAWAQRVETARKRGRCGDVLTLAGEAPTQALRVEAWKKAGEALRSMGQHAYALEQFERALEIDPEDAAAIRAKGMLLGKLGRHDEADTWFDAYLKDHAQDAEAWALAARLDKDLWTAAWRVPGYETQQRRQAAADEDGLLREAIRRYARGFRADPTHFYSGLNAVALMHLYRYLSGDERNAAELRLIEGGVRWALQRAREAAPEDYWVRASQADLEVLSAEHATVEDAYQDAIAVSEKDWFALDSTRQQLVLYRDLGFRTEAVEAALKIFERAIERLEAPAKVWRPRNVILFTGHMIDAPGRAQPRFPADKEAIAAQAIAAKLDALGVGAEDLGLSSGACGGDILFGETMLARGARLELRLPFEEAEFLAASVGFAGEGWRDRYYALRKNPNVRCLVMPRELGPLPPGANAYERANLWMLYSALSWGPDRVHCVCLWNRGSGDGPGGTKHLHDEVNKRTGQVHVLDTTKLW